MSKSVSYKEFIEIFKLLVEENKKTNDPIPELKNESEGKIKFYLEAPNQIVFGKEVYEGVYEKASILLYLIIKGHSLANGNKRMGLATMMFFLYKNSISLSLTDEEAYDLTVKVASSNSEDKDKTLNFIKQVITPKKITMNAKEIKENIETLNELIADSSTPKDEIETYKETLTVLKAKLEEIESKPAPAKKAPAKKVAKKEAPKKKEKKQDDHIITINGKAYDVADCREAIVAWEARSKQSKEASKDYKTKPVAEKVAANVATAVKQAADGISDTRMDKNSKSVVKGAQMIEKAIDMMFKGFEEMTGKKVSQEQRKQIMAILADVKEEAKS